jgi:cyclic 2,3-diphosphoglycerate synthetase
VVAEPGGRLRRRAVALVDGEHYPPVVHDALASLAPRVDVVAALLLGGGEKLRAAPSAETYAVPRLDVAGAAAEEALAALIADVAAELVVDLSDEPVVSQRSRLRLASVALAAGAGYEAAGLTLGAPHRVPYPFPSLAVVGTGKRVGKTAVSGHLARYARDRLDSSGRVVVVAMGRGGPPLPEVVDPTASEVGAAELLERARRGAHAASDYLEDAVLAGVVTVGCRRCGGGPSGEIAHGNVEEGARAAAALEPALTIFEGSGAAFPPVRCDRTLLVTSTTAEPEEVLGYLGPFRLLAADGIVIVTAGSDPRLDVLVDGIGRIAPGRPVVPVVLRPAPAAPVAGRRVAVFTTARAQHHEAIARDLSERHGATVVAVSGALSDRPALRSALEQDAIRTADVYLTEIKAAAVEVVVEAAAARGVELVFLDNEPAAADGGDALDELYAGLVDGARVAAS